MSNASTISNIGLFSANNRGSAHAAQEKSGRAEDARGSDSSSFNTGVWNAFFNLSRAPKAAQNIFEAIFRQFGALGIQTLRCLRSLDLSKPEALLAYIKNLQLSPSAERALTKALIAILENKPGHEAQLAALKTMHPEKHLNIQNNLRFK